MVSLISGCNVFFRKNSFKSLGLAAGIAIGLLIPQQSFAAAPGCDTAFMDSMKQKAWMEAQREIMIAQTVIAKPDSVFALGCFGHFTNGYTPQFTEGNQYQYGNKVNEFVSAAFGHSYGGGHYSGLGTNAGNNSTCDKIAKLWDAARKADLDIPTPLLGTLENFATYNRGAFPSTAPNPPGYGSTGDTVSPLGVFYGAKQANKSVNATFDDMNLFAGVTAPRSQLTAPGQCAQGIPTGVCMSIGSTNRPEIVCPNPGCVSDGQESPKCCDYSGGNCSAAFSAPAAPAPGSC